MTNSVLIEHFFHIHISLLLYITADFSFYFLCCLLAHFACADPLVALEAALQFDDTRESMNAYCVGHYMEVSKPN